ncbi:MAG: hypothetical protein QNK04_03735 [Myxococcota bacterium]|nr:hypothetical protein [Myxococcota bacterium]
MRTPIWTLALVLVAGGALAAPDRTPRLGPPTVSEAVMSGEGLALDTLVQPPPVELADEETQVARKSRASRGGGRGGSRAKSRGGFSRGGERDARRRGGERGRHGGEPGRRGGRRDVNVDRDVDIDADDLDAAYTSDEEKAAAALVGGVVGIGIGRRISESEDPGEDPEYTGY